MWPGRGGMCRVSRVCSIPRVQPAGVLTAGSHHSHWENHDGVVVFFAGLSEEGFSWSFVPLPNLPAPLGKGTADLLAVPCQGAGGKLHREPFLLKPGSCCFKKKKKKKKILCGLWRESARTVQDHDWKAGSLSGHGGFPGALQPAVDLARMLVPHSR